MKTNIKWFAALVATLLTVLAPASWAQGTIRFDAYAGVVQKPTSQATFNGIITAVQDGTPGNANWNYVTNGAILPLQQIFSSGTDGGVLRRPLAITDPTLFSLSQIQWVIENPLTGQSSGSFSSYSNRGVGINSGNDGVLGTDDDIIYTSNNGNTMVNAVYLIGLGSTIDIGSSSIEDALASWSGLTYENVSYTLNGTTVTSCINYSVPEPSSGAILMLGLIGLRSFQKRK